MTPRSPPPPYREQVPTTYSRSLDVALAASVTAVGVLELWVPFASRQGDGSLWATTATTAVTGLALTQRRRHPLAAGVVVLGCLPVAYAFVPIYVLFFGQFVPMGIALFTMARHGRGRVPAYGAAAGAGALIFVDLFVPVLQAPGEIVFHWGVFALVWGFGFGLRRHESRAEESQRRAVAAEVAAAEQAMAAVLEERTRIARELHDIVAHSVSVMVVQAGAAEQVVTEDPELVRRALATIRSTGTDALGEMRRVVAMLRDGDEPGALAPQPGVDGVPQLVEGARQAGLEVCLDVRGEPVPLPSGVDLAAYRIVQEALTNVRRHASASRAEVRLTYGPGDLRIEVSDDGVGDDGRPSAGGHGLVGMRERASLYGGHVETQAAAGRGFVVRAVLPVGVTA
jgi:signal transduction histidine kinase